MKKGFELERSRKQGSHKIGFKKKTITTRQNAQKGRVGNKVIFREGSSQEKEWQTKTDGQ